MTNVYVNASKLKSLEDYAVALTSVIITLKTLESFQVRAMELGILPEDMECRTNTILWDLRRMIKLYQDQLEACLELLPEDFTPESIVKSLIEQEKTRARSLLRKKVEESK